MNRKLKSFISIMMTIAMVAGMFSMVFANEFKETDVDQYATGIIGIILTVISYAGWGVALGMLVYIGIKYMMTGAGEKAKVKETLLPYLIGALIVGSAAYVVKTVLGINKVVNNLKVN